MGEFDRILKNMKSLADLSLHKGDVTLIKELCYTKFYVLNDDGDPIWIRGLREETYEIMIKRIEYLKSRVKQLEEQKGTMQDKIIELEDEITHLKYKPDGDGYLLSKKHFETTSAISDI